jgi:hypothetical protein
MKKEFNKDMENFRNKNQTEILEIKSSLNQIKNTDENHSSRLEQVEDIISGLEDKIDINCPPQKVEESFEKILKSCERNIQERSDSIKDQTCKPWTLKKKKSKSKGICNTFNKIITENFPNLEKKLLIQV